MNKLLFRCTVGIMLFTMLACKKRNQTISDNTATIHVINGIVTENIQLKMNGRLNESGANSSNSQVSTVFFGTAAFYYAERKSTSLEVLKNNTTTSLFSNTYDLKGGSIYTMLLAGISPNVEAVMIDDSHMPKVDLSKIPSDADSVINVRFINLSPNVQPVNIRIQGSSTNEANALPYKGYTSFKAYSVKASVIRYTFEFVENGAVIATRNITMSAVSRFKSAAVVLYGLKGSSLSTATMYYAQ